ncbi:large subunit ribosomal protein L24e, partial [Tremellales sp. Uapishka_1]
MKRNPRKVRWTKAFRRANGKEMVIGSRPRLLSGHPDYIEPSSTYTADPIQDSTFEFEKRRNVPVRYDRELVATTLEAMKRVQEIKEKREKAFWKNRMAGNPARNLRAQAADIERHIELVRPRSKTASTSTPNLAEKEKIREKIKVRAAGRKAMAQDQIKKAGAMKRESKLIPASGGGMGMGMHVD